MSSTSDSNVTGSAATDEESIGDLTVALAMIPSAIYKAQYRAYQWTHPSEDSTSDDRWNAWVTFRLSLLDIQYWEDIVEKYEGILKSWADMDPASVHDSFAKTYQRARDWVNGNTTGNFNRIRAQIRHTATTVEGICETNGDTAATSYCATCRIYLPRCNVTNGAHECSQDYRDRWVGIPDTNGNVTLHDASKRAPDDAWPIGWGFS